MDVKTISATAALMGFDTLTPQAESALAVHVDHKLRLVVQVCFLEAACCAWLYLFAWQEAVRIMRHSKRSVLRVDDIKQCLKAMKVPVCFQFDFALYASIQEK